MSVSHCEWYHFITLDAPLPHPLGPHTWSGGVLCSLLHFSQTGLFVSILLAPQSLVWSVPQPEQSSSISCEGMFEGWFYTHVIDTQHERGKAVGIATYLVGPPFGPAL